MIKPIVIVMAAIVILVSTFSAHSQTPAKVPRIGFLSLTTNTNRLND